MDACTYTCISSPDLTQYTHVLHETSTSGLLVSHVNYHHRLRLLLISTRRICRGVSPTGKPAAGRNMSVKFADEEKGREAQGGAEAASSRPPLGDTRGFCEATRICRSRQGNR